MPLFWRPELAKDIVIEQVKDKMLVLLNLLPQECTAATFSDAQVELHVEQPQFVKSLVRGWLGLICVALVQLRLIRAALVHLIQLCGHPPNCMALRWKCVRGKQSCRFRFQSLTYDAVPTYLLRCWDAHARSNPSVTFHERLLCQALQSLADWNYTHAEFVRNAAPMDLGSHRPSTAQNLVQYIEVCLLREPCFILTQPRYLSLRRHRPILQEDRSQLQDKTIYVGLV